MYSAYMMSRDNVWVGTHRLPLEMAIHYCREYRSRLFGCPVALVPDDVDPKPYFRLAEQFA